MTCEKERKLMIEELETQVSKLRSNLTYPFAMDFELLKLLRELFECVETIQEILKNDVR